MKNLSKMIEDVLREDTKTRDCDTLLMVSIWRRYYPQMLIDGQAVRLDMIKELPSPESIARIRRLIQNKKLLYMPTSLAVAKGRGIMERIWRERMRSGELFP